MFNKRTVAMLLLLGGFLAAPRTARAVALSDLFSTPGASITADDKLFDRFTLLELTVVNGGFANLDQIDVSPLIDDPLNPGLKFNAPIDGIGTPFGHVGLSSVRLKFSFNAQVTTGLPLIKDNSLLINGWLFDAGPDAFIRITEEIFGVTGAPLGDKLAIVFNGDVPGDPDHFDSAEFSPRAFVHVVKTIDVVGPGINDGARLTMFEQRFSQVPEPSTLTLTGVLFLCGLVTAAWRRR